MRRNQGNYNQLELALREQPHCVQKQLDGAMLASVLTSLPASYSYADGGGQNLSASSSLDMPSIEGVKLKYYVVAYE
jgi:hypothetical protein